MLGGPKKEAAWFARSLHQERGLGLSIDAKRLSRITPISHVSPRIGVFITN